MAHDDDLTSDVNDPGADDLQTPPRVVPARPPRPISRAIESEGSETAPSGEEPRRGWWRSRKGDQDDDGLGAHGRHRSDATSPAEPIADTDTVAPWLAPPTTEPVDAPPPVSFEPEEPAFDLPIDDPELPAGGWFRRRTGDSPVVEPVVEISEPEPADEPAPEVVNDDNSRVERRGVIRRTDHQRERSKPLLEPEFDPEADAETDADTVAASPLEGDAVPTVSVRDGRALTVVIGLIAVLAAVAVGLLWPTDVGSQAGTATDRDVAPLAAALGIFALLIIAAARWRGLRAVVAVAVSVAAITFFVLPSIRDDHPPLAVAGAAAVLLAVVVGYLVHGTAPRASAAILGTLVGLGITAALGYLSAKLIDLPTDGDSGAHQLTAAAAVIAAVGLLLDLTSRQAEATNRIRLASPTASAQSVLALSMERARTLVSSSLLTLTFAFAGAALVGLLAASASSEDVGSFLTGEVAATELLRVAACGLAGLVALPVTALVADRLARGVVAAEDQAARIADRVARLSDEE